MIRGEERICEGWKGWLRRKVVAVWYLYSDRKKMAGGFTVHQRKSLSAPITKIYAGRFSAAGGSWRSVNTLVCISTSALPTCPTSQLGSGESFKYQSKQLDQTVKPWEQSLQSTSRIRNRLVSINRFALRTFIHLQWRPLQSQPRSWPRSQRSQRASTVSTTMTRRD